MEKEKIERSLIGYIEGNNINEFKFLFTSTMEPTISSITQVLLGGVGSIKDVMINKEIVNIGKEDKISLASKILENKVEQEKSNIIKFQKILFDKCVLKSFCNERLEICEYLLKRPDYALSKINYNYLFDKIEESTNEDKKITKLELLCYNLKDREELIEIMTYSRYTFKDHMNNIIRAKIEKEELIKRHVVEKEDVIKRNVVDMEDIVEIKKKVMKI